jgi:hypothetical protein
MGEHEYETIVDAFRQGSVTTMDDVQLCGVWPA